MLYTYEEVLNRIESAHRFGKQPGVEVTTRILDVLGHPMNGLPYIHVAGTNGKGSTCAFLDSILSEAGLKVGKFTSPHLVDFRERITVNGKMIGKSDVTKIGNRLFATGFDIPLTMFDYSLAMAILYFCEKGCDIAIIETGLGGRLDSTNALGTPELTVITRIGYDHTAVLGDTLSKIASEKAGILRQDVPVILGRQEPEAMKVLMDHMNSLQQKADYYVIEDEDVRRASEYQPGLIGTYQYENAAIAEAAVVQMWKQYQDDLGLQGDKETIERQRRILRATELLKADRRSSSSHMESKWRDISEEDLYRYIRDGIHKASWPGRMEILSESPFFMVDGAHNASGVRALAQSLMDLYPDEKFHFVMGVMSDKDYKAMVELLLPAAIDFVTVTPDSERAMQAEELARFIQSKGIPAKALESVEHVRSLPVKGERTIALGSLYFIGDVKRLWQ